MQTTDKTRQASLKDCDGQSNQKRPDYKFSHELHVCS